MDLTKHDYLEARQIVDAYEKELLNTNGTPVYILFNLDADAAIVLDNEDFAKRLLEKNGTYDQMKVSKLYSVNRGFPNEQPNGTD